MFRQTLLLLHMKTNISHILSLKMSQAENLLRSKVYYKNFCFHFTSSTEKPNFERNSLFVNEKINLF